MIIIMPKSLRQANIRHLQGCINEELHILSVLADLGEQFKVDHPDWTDNFKIVFKNVLQCKEQIEFLRDAM